ncbi:unnamed protein product [Pylaiella littoralis]
MLKASCVKRLEVMKFISEGVFGHVFRALRNDGTRAVIKVRLQQGVPCFGHSRKNYHGKGLAPKILEGKKPTEKIGTRATERPRIR